MQVYKLLRPGEMAAYERDGEVPLSPDDARDGYVHLSTAAQLAGTIGKHFTEEPSVCLLAIDADRLGEGLRWEPSRGGELFPHFYGRLRREHQAAIWSLGRGPDGRFSIPREVG